MMDKRPEALDYEERHTRVPLSWHFFYGHRVVWNWLMLFIAVMVLVVIGFFTMAGLYGIAG